ncbi:MAG: TraR/DksA family transcriptional regulator [Candidatus Scalindua sp.]
MNKKVLNQLRDQLKDRRHHLLKEVKLRLMEFRDSGGYRLTDTADIASNLIDEEIVMSIAQGEAREIEEIDNALSQIKKGTYGVCGNCGRKINKQRIMAIPFVSLCIKCKEAEERDEGIQTDRGGYYRIESVDYGEFERDDEKGKNIKYFEKSDINPFDN